MKPFALERLPFLKSYLGAMLLIVIAITMLTVVSSNFLSLKVDVDL
jgi:hypothetical protein